MPQDILADGRNYNKIQFEKLRRNIDPAFNYAHDKLGDAYRVDKTIDKAAFDTLHGLLWHIYDVYFHLENQKQTTPYDVEKYENRRNPNDGSLVSTRTDEAVNALKAAPVALRRAILTRIEAEGIDLKEAKAVLGTKGVSL
ncbi:MAG: hypothetical protein ACE5E0_03440 [Terriglobia bacterium]